MGTFFKFAAVVYWQQKLKAEGESKSTKLCAAKELGLSAIATPT